MMLHTGGIAYNKGINAIYECYDWGIMKYYFFRDIDNESNLLCGKTYHAAGYVEELYCELDKLNPSGKDIVVSFFEPFKGTMTSAWRAVNEVELFEVAECEYRQLVKNYNTINALHLF